MSQKTLLSEIIELKQKNAETLGKALKATKTRVAKAKELLDREFWDHGIGSRSVVTREYNGEYEVDPNICKLESVTGDLIGRAVVTKEGLITAEHCLEDEIDCGIVDILVNNQRVVASVKLRHPVWDLVIMDGPRTGYDVAPYVCGEPIQVAVLGVVHTLMAEPIPSSSFICFPNDDLRLGEGFSGTPIFQDGKVVAIFVGIQQVNPICFATLVKFTTKVHPVLPPDFQLCMPRNRRRMLVTSEGTTWISQSNRRTLLFAEPDESLGSYYSEDFDDDFKADEGYDSEEDIYDEQDYYGNERRIKTRGGYLSYNGTAKGRKKNATSLPVTEESLVVVTSHQAAALVPTIETLFQGVEDDFMPEVKSENVEELGIVFQPATPEFSPQDIEELGFVYNPETTPQLSSPPVVEEEKVEIDQTQQHAVLDVLFTESDRVCPPPPPPREDKEIWKRAYDVDGTPYWYNHKNETTWINPNNRAPTPTQIPPAPILKRSVANAVSASVVVDPKAVTQKDFSKIKEDLEKEKLREEIKLINSQGTYLDKFIELNEDQKSIYPVNTWEKMTLILTLKMLRAKHNSRKQQAAQAEKQRKELLRAQESAARYQEELARLTEKIKTLEKTGLPKQDF